MKKLYNFLKEGLLDDFDDLIDVSDKNVQHTAVDAPGFIEEYGGGWKVENNTAVLGMGYNGRMCKTNLRTLSHIIVKGQKSIDEWLGTDEVRIDKPGLWLEGNLISKDTFTKKLTMRLNGGYLRIIGRNLVVKDIDIETPGKMSIADDWGQLKLENVNIILNNSIKDLNFHGKLIPSFKKFKSNVRTMQISDTFMWEYEEGIKQMDEIFDFPYTCKVYDIKKKEEVDIKIKTFKKIHAIINNQKRYSLREPILKFKSGFKVNDLLDISGCKDLTDIFINNNLVTFHLSKHKPNSTWLNLA